MARPARIEFEGAFYHVMNRGNRREDIFLDACDWEKFYEILGNIERWSNFSSKELSGAKPFRTKISINTLEDHVCKEFEVEKEELEIPRGIIILPDRQCCVWR